MIESKPKNNYWIRSGAYTMSQRIAAFLFGFGSYFFLIRYFDVDVFGIWTLFVLIASVVEMSRSAFIQNAFIKFFNQNDVDRGNLFTASLILNIATTLIFILLLSILIPVLQIYWATTLIRNLILCYFLTSLILVPLTQLNYLEQANHSFAGVFWSTVVRQGAFFIIVILCYFFFPGLPVLFFAAMQSLAAALGLIVALFFSSKYLPKNYVIDKVLLERLYKFGRYILGTGITSTVGKSADQFILGSVSHGMVAIFNAGVRIINFIEIPSLSISNITYPKMAERTALDGVKGMGILYEKSVATILAFILPVVIFVVLFPEFVLLITAGSKYLDAATPLRIMTITAIFLPFNIQIGSACEVANKPHISFYINLISNILNIALNLILINLFGIMGAAVSYGITLTFIFIVGQWYMISEFGINILSIPKLVLDFYTGAARKILNLLRRKKNV
jgi:lipopolysaccharide exporter